MKDTIEFNRCQNLKAFSVPAEVREYFDDLMVDYKRYLPVILDWTGCGYTRRIGDKLVVVSPEVVVAQVRAECGGLADDMLQIGRTLAQGSQEEASSFYGLFYVPYASTGKAKLTPSRRAIIVAAKDWVVGAEKEHEKREPLLVGLGVDTLKNYSSRLHGGESINSIWDECGPKIVNPFIASVIKVRGASPLPCCRPNDKNYCSILAELIRSQVSSCCGKKYTSHIEDRAKLLELVEASRPSPDLMEALACLQKSLGENYTFSRWLLFAAVNLVRQNSPFDYRTEAMVAALRQPGCVPLVRASDKDIGSCYYYLKLKGKFDRSKIYPERPADPSDRKVLFGLSSLGKFSLAMDQGRLTVTLCDMPAIRCMRSHYFNDLSIEEIHSNKRLSGYTVRFNHLTKNRLNSPAGPVINAVIKTVGLYRKNGQYFITIPYTVTHDKANDDLAIFLRTATPTKEKIQYIQEKFPNGFVAAGFDLNLSDPVCGAMALVRPDGEGKIPVRDYGSANLVAEPQVIERDTPNCDKLRSLSSQFRQITQYIRGYRQSLRTGTVPGDLAIELGVPGNFSAIRYKIQNLIAEARAKFKQLHFQIRAKGYPHVSEMIRILDVQDALASLKSSYDRIHLKAGESMPAVRAFDRKRTNFRQFTSRRLAASIVRYSAPSNVIVVEDLTMKQDRDDSSNSMTRLFAPRQLIDSITMAAEKVGKSVVEVDPRGTSRCDPLTGDFGYRPKKIDKKSLYVERDGSIVRYDSDIAASVNVLKRGLDHGVTPYKVFVKGKPSATSETFDRKRLSRFCAEKYKQLTLPKFKNDGPILRATNAKDGDLYHGFAYLRGGELISHKAKIEIEDRIRLRIESGERAIPLTITC